MTYLKKSHYEGMPTSTLLARLQALKPNDTKSLIEEVLATRTDRSEDSENPVPKAAKQLKTSRVKPSIDTESASKIEDSATENQIALLLDDSQEIDPAQEKFENALQKPIKIVKAVKAKIAKEPKVKKVKEPKEPKVRAPRVGKEDPKFKKIREGTFNDITIGDKVHFILGKGKYGFPTNSKVEAQVEYFEKLRGSEKMYAMVKAVLITGDSRVFGVSLDRLRLLSEEPPLYTKRQERKAERDAEKAAKPKRVLTDEHKMKMNAGRIAKAKLKESEQATSESVVETLEQASIVKVEDMIDIFTESFGLTEQPLESASE